MNVLHLMRGKFNGCITEDAFDRSGHENVGTIQMLGIEDIFFLQRFNHTTEAFFTGTQCLFCCATITDISQRDRDKNVIGCFNGLSVISTGNKHAHGVANM